MAATLAPLCARALRAAFAVGAADREARGNGGDAHLPFSLPEARGPRAHDKFTIKFVVLTASGAPK
eukprot:937498-Pyramimonas_sp.AAC.1